jgi:hypothetical protein
MRIFILPIFALALSSCTGGGFSATIKDSVQAKTQVETQTQADMVGSQIVLAGALVESGADGLKGHGQINAPEATLRQFSDNSALKNIESRNDFVVIGCPASMTNIGDLTSGLREQKVNLDENSSNLALKARLVVLCGKPALPQSFISVVADQIALIDFNLEISGKEEIGFFALSARKLILTGKNQITPREVRAAKGLAAHGPSLFFFSESPLEGQGTLLLKVER